MFGWFKKKTQKAPAVKEIMLHAVADGELIPIEDVKDIVFSQKMMGDGFAIIPTNGTISAPILGKVENVFPTKHAIGFSYAGLEVLLHMGIDTVALNGEPFDTIVSEGQEVEPSTRVSEVDLEMLGQENKDTAMIVIFTNGNDVVESFELTASGPVTKGQIIGKIVLK